MPHIVNDHTEGVVMPRVADARADPFSGRSRGAAYRKHMPCTKVSCEFRIHCFTCFTPHEEQEIDPDAYCEAYFKAWVAPLDPAKQL
jgi:hypothetical protein